MLKLSYLFILFLIGSKTAINQGQLNNPKHLSVLTANSTSFSGGRSNAPFGTDYTFLVKLNTASPIVFDSVWINNHAYKLVASKSATTVSNTPTKYSIGDTVTLKATAFFSRGSESNSTQLAANPPIVFKGKALIRYYLHTKPYYSIIKNINAQYSPRRS